MVYLTHVYPTQLSPGDHHQLPTFEFVAWAAKWVVSRKGTSDLISVVHNFHYVPNIPGDTWNSKLKQRSTASAPHSNHRNNNNNNNNNNSNNNNNNNNSNNKNTNTSLVQLVFVHPCFSVPVETSAPRKSSKCGSVIHFDDRSRPAYLGWLRCLVMSVRSMAIRCEIWIDAMWMPFFFVGECVLYRDVEGIGRCRWKMACLIFGEVDGDGDDSSTRIEI